MSLPFPVPEAAPEEAAILCFSHLRWDFVFQRPQHLLTRAAQHYEVWYFEEPMRQEGRSPNLKMRTHSSGVRIVTPILPAARTGDEDATLLQELICRAVSAVRSPTRIGWYYTPMALTVTDKIDFDVCLYDNMDELSTFAGAPAELMALEQALFARADIVFTGGQSLYEAKCKRHRNIHPFPSSIDASHFAKVRMGAEWEPDDQSGIAGPRVGFFGVIDERMNVDLVAALAALRPSWQFVMIGPVAKIDPASLPRRPNIHWLGPKSYDELPNYLAGWNVGFMPFALNAATRYISPTKTLEFLAAGIPLVSTSIADVIRPYGQLGLVEIADDPVGFAEKIDVLLSRPTRPWLARVDLHLRSTSWDLTWHDMNALIVQALSSRAQPSLTQAAE
jgi:glycosyltransferase involved in cell wall biosynthesis